MHTNARTNAPVSHSFRAHGREGRLTSRWKATTGSVARSVSCCISNNTHTFTFCTFSNRTPLACGFTAPTKRTLRGCVMLVVLVVPERRAASDANAEEIAMSDFVQFHIAKEGAMAHIVHQQAIAAKALKSAPIEVNTTTTHTHHQSQRKRSSHVYAPSNYESIHESTQHPRVVTHEPKGQNLQHNHFEHAVNLHGPVGTEHALRNELLVELTVKINRHVCRVLFVSTSNKHTHQEWLKHAPKVTDQWRIFNWVGTRDWATRQRGEPLLRLHKRVRYCVSAMQPQSTAIHHTAFNKMPIAPPVKTSSLLRCDSHQLTHQNTVS